MTQLHRLPRFKDSSEARGGGTLLLRGGALGDFLLTLPAIRAIRQHFPGRLELCAHPAYAELAFLEGLADAYRDLGSGAMAPFFAPNSKWDAGWCRWFSGFDRVISWLRDPGGCLRDNLRRIGAGPVLEIDPRIAGHGPAAPQLAAPLGSLGVPTSDPVPRLARAFPRATGGLPTALSRIAIHPGSGSPRKNWPAENWNQLARWLPSLHPDLRLCLIGGEADTAPLRTTAAGLDVGRSDLLESRPLTEVAATLARCGLFLGHDSGISHLAAAVGTPCLLLFGPTDPAVWAPVGDHVRVLRAPNAAMAGLEWEIVRRAVSDLATCSSIFG